MQGSQCLFPAKFQTILKQNKTKTHKKTLDIYQPFSLFFNDYNHSLIFIHLRLRFIYWVCRAFIPHPICKLYLDTLASYSFIWRNNLWTTLMKILFYIFWDVCHVLIYTYIVKWLLQSNKLACHLPQFCVCVCMC